MCVAGLTGGTARCAHIHSPGPGVRTDNINKRPQKPHYGGLGAWWKMLLQISNENPKDRGYILVHFQLQTAEAR